MDWPENIDFRHNKPQSETFQTQELTMLGKLRPDEEMNGFDERL